MRSNLRGSLLIGGLRRSLVDGDIDIETPLDPELISYTVVPDGIDLVFTGSITRAVSDDKIVFTIGAGYMANVKASITNIGGQTVGFQIDDGIVEMIDVPVASIEIVEGGTVPSLPSLSHGRTFEGSVPDWDEIIDPSHYTSSAGAIASVDVTFTGDADAQFEADTPFVAGQNLGYTITVTDSAANTEQFILDPVLIAPVAPSNVTGLLVAQGDGEASLAWDAPVSNGGAAVTSYRIERNAAGAGWVFLVDTGTASLTYTDTTTNNSTVYQYRVSAENSVDVGPVSNVATTEFTSDVTPPVMQDVNPFDDATDTFDVIVNEPSQLMMATHLSTEIVSQDGLGGWTGNVVETFAFSITGGAVFNPVVTDLSIDRVSRYVRDAAGNDGPLFTDAITFPPSYPFVEDFARPADEPMDASPNWSIAFGTGLQIIGGNARTTSNTETHMAWLIPIDANCRIDTIIHGVIGAHWVFLRATDYDNAIACRIKANGRVNLFDKVAGALGAELGELNLDNAKADGDEYSFEADGNTLTVTRNDGTSGTFDLTGLVNTTGGVFVGVSGDELGFKQVEFGELS